VECTNLGAGAPGSGVLLAPSPLWCKSGSGLEGQAGLGGPTGVVWSGGRRHVGGPVSARTIAARVGVVAPDSREWYVCPLCCAGLKVGAVLVGTVWWAAAWLANSFAQFLHAEL
jgi:hypothetical protein